MIKKEFLFLLFPALLGAAELQYTRKVDTPVWRIPRPGRTFKKVKIFAERQPYKPNQNFQPRFIDRPLFTDSSIRNELEKQGFLKDVEVVKMSGYEGFATIAYDSLHIQHLKFLKEAGVKNYEHAIVFGTDGMLKEKDYQAWKKRLIASADSPHMAKYDGRIICFNYGSPDPRLIASLKEFIPRLHADKDVPPFLFISDLSFLSLYNAFNRQQSGKGDITEAEIEDFRRQLREQLQVFDGVQLRVHEIYRRYNGEYARHCLPTDLYEKYLLPVLQEEFAKPEHKGKLIGLYPRHGYYNHMRGILTGEFGTETIRTYLTGAAKMAPDVIMLFEWNEANENTHFQPTVANGRSLERIMHYARKCFDDEDPTPRPGDDLTIPNMVLSVPQQLRVGEILHLELLNIPDGTVSENLSAVLSLYDDQYRKIIDLPAEKFDRKELRAVTWRFPAEQLAPYQAVNYQLTVSENGKTVNYQNFDATKIVASSHIRYKYTRTPLREILEPEKFYFTAERNIDGTYTVNAEFSGSEELASLEVVDNHVEVYSLDRNKEFENRAAFRGYLTANEMVGSLSGRFSFPGVKDWKVRSLNGCMMESFSTGVNLGSKIVVSNYFQPEGRGNFIISVPLDEMSKNPKFKVEFRKQPAVEIDLAKVWKEGKFALYIGKNIRLELYRADRLWDYPHHLNASSGSIKTVIRPAEKHPLVHLRAVSKSGKIFRSPSISVCRSGVEKEKMTIWSETYKKPVDIMMAVDRIPDIKAVFSPGKGLFMGNSESPYWDFMLGGGHTAGETMQESIKTAIAKKYLPADFTVPYPEWVKKDGQDMLRFDGKGNYLLMARDLIPRSSPFTLSFEILRESDANEVLIRSCTFESGRSYNLELFIENSELKGVYHDTRHYLATPFITGLQVPAGVWTKITVTKSVDQLIFDVDGKSKSFNFTQRGALTGISSFGGAILPTKHIPAGLSFFKGYLRSFHIRHNVK